MFKNYITIAFRKLWHNKTLLFLNVFGLALGIACSILIFLWIYNEKSIDAFHPSNLYAIFQRNIHDGKIEAKYETPAKLAD